MSAVMAEVRPTLLKCVQYCSACVLQLVVRAILQGRFLIKLLEKENIAQYMCTHAQVFYS